MEPRTLAYVTGATVLYCREEVAVVSPQERTVLRLFYSKKIRRKGCDALPPNVQRDYDLWKLLDGYVSAGDDSVQFLHSALNLPDGVWVMDLPRQDFERVAPTTKGPLDYVRNVQSHFKKIRPVPLRLYENNMRHAGLRASSPVSMTDHRRLQGQDLRACIQKKRVSPAAVLHDPCDFIANLVAHVALVIQEGMYMGDLSPANLILQPSYTTEDDMGYILHIPGVHDRYEGVLTPPSMGLIDATIVREHSNYDSYPVTTMATRPYAQFVQTAGRIDAAQTIESLGWLCMQLVLTVDAIRESSWHMLALVLPREYRYNGTFPTLTDVLLKYSQVGTLALKNGAVQESIDLGIDRMLGELADYALSTPGMLPYLHTLDDYRLDVEGIRTDKHPKHALCMALKANHFLTALRTCFGRLVMTGRWDYFRVFSKLFPPDSAFLALVKSTARSSIDTNGRVLHASEGGILYGVCGRDMASLLVDMVLGRMDCSEDVLARVAPLFPPSRHIVIPPDKRADFDTQCRMQHDRGRLVDNQRDFQRTHIVAIR